MSWQWGVLHWLVEHSYDFCDFFSSPVSRVVTWSQPPVNIHELDHVDHDCLISLRSLGATTPFQVDAMPLTYHLSINASPNFNIISSFKHHSAPRWMTWIHPKKINHRTWFLMLGKMIFLFQGKNLRVPWENLPGCMFHECIISPFLHFQLMYLPQPSVEIVAPPHGEHHRRLRPKSPQD